MPLSGGCRRRLFGHGEAGAGVREPGAGGEGIALALVELEIGVGDLLLDAGGKWVGGCGAGRGHRTCGPGCGQAGLARAGGGASAADQPGRGGRDGERPGSRGRPTRAPVARPAWPPATGESSHPVRFAVLVGFRAVGFRAVGYRSAHTARLSTRPRRVRANAGPDDPPPWPRSTHGTAISPFPADISGGQIGRVLILARGEPAQPLHPPGHRQPVGDGQHHDLEAGVGAEPGVDVSDGAHVRVLRRRVEHAP